MIFPGHPNILAIENHNLFTDCPNIARLISELREELYRHPNLALLLLERSNGSSRDEPPTSFRMGDHRFERRFRNGQVGHTLLCLNRYAGTMASPNLVAALSNAVFGCSPQQSEPTTETISEIGGGFLEGYDR